MRFYGLSRVFQIVNHERGVLKDSREGEFGGEGGELTLQFHPLGLMASMKITQAALQNLKKESGRSEEVIRKISQDTSLYLPFIDSGTIGTLRGQVIYQEEISPCFS